MPRRDARPEDKELVRPMLQLGYPKVDWTEEATERFLASEGVHLFDPDNLAYLYLALNPNLLNKSPVPEGPATEIAALIPQHHDQEWVDNVLAPLLARGLRKMGTKYPQMRRRPLYCFLAPDLYPYWTHIIPASIVPRRSGAHLAWMPTLTSAIAKVRGI